jgi:hypothetical protein
MIEVPPGIGLIATIRQWSSITAVYIKTVIHMAAEVVGAVKPRANAEEDTTVKPFRAVIAVGSTSIRSGVVIAVRAYRFGSDVDANVSFGRGGDCHCARCNSGKRECTSESVHDCSSVWCVQSI